MTLETRSDTFTHELARSDGHELEHGDDRTTVNESEEGIRVVNRDTGETVVYDIEKGVQAMSERELH